MPFPWGGNLTLSSSRIHCLILLSQSGGNHFTPASEPEPCPQSFLQSNKVKVWLMLVTPNQPGLPWVTPHSPVKQLSGFLPAIPELEGQTTSSAMGIYFIYFIYFLRFFCHKFSFLFVFGFFLFVCLFVFVFQGCTCGIWKFPGQRLKWSCSCRPQQCQISHNNARSEPPHL